MLLAAAVSAAVETNAALRDRQRDALIDHLIDAHDAQDRVASHWPILDKLRREHAVAHQPLSRYGQPSHRHHGDDLWEQRANGAGAA